MKYSALDIAKYVICHEHEKGREISNLRLQKLLYFVQAKVLVETDDACFDDTIEAWDYGPVVPIVYHEYKIFGSLDIKIKSAKVKIDEKIANLIDLIVDYCSNFPTYQLVKITHEQDPWKKAYKRGVGVEIKSSSIKEFFRSNDVK